MHRSTQRRLDSESRQPLCAGRRDLLKGMGLALASGGWWTQTRAQTIRSALNKLQLGMIGLGIRGKDQFSGIGEENVAAICDVDQAATEAIRWRCPDARQFIDYREMLDAMRLDGVIISTPDHHHFLASYLAIKRKIPVFCEKPLAHSVAETRTLRELAASTGVVTQVGHQFHDCANYRRVKQWITNGEIGNVQDVHVWTNTPTWPQGISRPADAPPCPKTLHWDLWLGPAPERTYHPAYHPLRWRGWRDFGTGAIGDLGSQLMDVVITALDLSSPKSIVSHIKQHPSEAPETFPAASHLQFEFGDEPSALIQVHWYDGGLQPGADITGVDRLPPHGILFRGSDGRIFVPDHGGRSRLLDNNGGRRDKPDVTEVVDEGLMENWIKAIRNPQPTICDFVVGANITQTCLLGNIASSTDEKLIWDDPTGSFANSSSADAQLRRDSRPGWTTT